MYSANLDIRSFEASVATEGRRIVAAAGAGNKVRAGAANTDKVLGVSERVGADAGGMLDVIVGGRTEVIAGAAFDLGDQLTCDAQGRAIKAVAVGNAVVRTAGFAHGAANAAGDIVPIHVVPGILTKPAA